MDDNLRFERQRFAAELRLKRSELILKRMEIEAQHQERLSKRAFPVSPVSATLIVAFIGLLGTSIGYYLQGRSNLALERLKYETNLELERLKFESNLILRATEVKDQKEAANNLTFFVRAGFIRDQGGKIARLAQQDSVPTTYVASTGNVFFSRCTGASARVGFVSESVPDDTEVSRGATFSKSFTIRNEGSCTLDSSFQLRYVSHTLARLSTPIAQLPIDDPVPPGGTFTFVIPMRAPNIPGRYRENWQLVDQVGRVVPINMSPVVWAQLVVR